MTEFEKQVLDKLQVLETKLENLERRFLQVKSLLVKQEAERSPISVVRARFGLGKFQK